MSIEPRWLLSAKEQQKHINALTSQLPALRAKLGVTQNEFAYLAGISRQTYSSIESGKKTMTWSTYLAILMIFECNLTTRDMLRSLKVYPEEMVDRFNEGVFLVNDSVSSSEIQVSMELARMFRNLDDSAKETLNATMLVEYARCTGKTDRLLHAIKVR